MQPRLKFVVLAFILGFTFLSVLYQIRITYGPSIAILHDVAHTPFERMVIEMTLSKDWATTRDLRNHCNSAFQDDIARFSDISCRAEFAHRMRQNSGDSIISIYKFIDHWTDEPSLAIEVKIARNVTALFKPCSVIPETDSLDHQILEDQIAPIVSTRMDPRMIRTMASDRKSWNLAYNNISLPCEQEKYLTASKSAPRTPGCMLYVTDSLLQWNMENYGAKLENILPLLRCKEILLDDI